MTSMLPKEFTDLFDGFIRVYDAEHSMPIELRNAHNRAAASVQSSGQGYHISRLVPYLAKNLLECIEKRGQFILEKFKVIWTSTQIELYPDLSVDLKSQIAGYLNPSRQAAESYLEHMRISGNVPSGYTVETKRAFDNILPRIYAEVDLLCASGFTKAKIHNSTAKAPNQVFNIGSRQNSRRIRLFLKHILNRKNLRIQNVYLWFMGAIWHCVIPCSHSCGLLDSSHWSGRKQ